MSKEREFLKKLRYASLLENDLRKELEELLAQPEPAPLPQRAPISQREAYQRGYEAARRDYKQKVINAFGGCNE